MEMEDASESESQGTAFAFTHPLILDETQSSRSLDILLMQPKCEVYPDLHKIIQVRSRNKATTVRSKIVCVKVYFMFIKQEKFIDILSQYFKAVPSNPHYYFYCPSVSKKDVSPRLC